MSEGDRTCPFPWRGKEHDRQPGKGAHPEPARTARPRGSSITSSPDVSAPAGRKCQTADNAKHALVMTSPICSSVGDVRLYCDAIINPCSLMEARDQLTMNDRENASTSSMPACG